MASVALGARAMARAPLASSNLRQRGTRRPQLATAWRSASDAGEGGDGFEDRKVNVRDFLRAKQKASEAHFAASEQERRNKESSKPSINWRQDAGHTVPYRYRFQAGRDPKEQLPYSDYSGLRFPTLETAENYDYHKDRGLDRVAFERAYPVKVPGYRRLGPYLREYIHFLHTLDPVRFSIPRIAERYRMREKTVKKVVQEWSTIRYITRSGLVRRYSEKQKTREAAILQRKEEMYGKWVGWDEMGDIDGAESDDETLGPYKGWRSTSDWIRRQSVEVEMMHAFPMSEKKNPMPKRVDVDMVVSSRKEFKIINWLDFNDKVVF